MTDTFHPACLLNHTLARAPAVAIGPAVFVEQTTGAAAAAPVIFHTVREVALTLGVSTKTIDRRIRDGVIHKAPIGGRLVRISSTELQRLAAGAPFRAMRPGR